MQHSNNLGITLLLKQPIPNGVMESVDADVS